MIYFIHAPEVRRVKIGFSKDWQQRFLDFMVGCPTMLDLLVVAPGTVQQEHGLHSLFGWSRWRGEWFNETPELMAFCERLKAVPEADRQSIIADAIEERRQRLAAEKIAFDKDEEVRQFRTALMTFVKKHGAATTATVAGIGLQMAKLLGKGKYSLSGVRFQRLLAFDPEPFAPFFTYFDFKVIGQDEEPVEDLRALVKEAQALICQIETEQAA